MTNPIDFETLCVGAGAGTRHGDPLVTPIVQSTTFCREGLAAQPPHAYSRQSNPTVEALEDALGALEEARPAVCFSTGLAAETALFLALLSRGDHVVCSRAVYGGTARLLEQVLTGCGIDSDFVDTTDIDAVEDAFTERTRLLFLETPANPTLDVSDIREIAERTRRRGIVLAVDNTFLTPVLQQPLELGADVSVYSTTKLIEGHSTALGGALVTRDDELSDRLRFIRLCTGGIQTPLNAWLTLQGLKTLPVRLARQCDSARRIADVLATVPEVTRVLYPSLDGFAGADIARRQHVGGHGAVVSFELEGGAGAARDLLERVKLCRLVEHVGSVGTLLTHSATMTHGGMSPDQRADVGITDGLLRISVGLESPDAILEDLIGAITAGTRAAREGGASCLANA